MSFAYMKHPVIASHTSYISVVSLLLMKYRISYDFDEKFRFLILKNVVVTPPPFFFRKHMSWGIGTECLGMIGCIFAENGPLEGGIESSFSGTGWGAKGDFRWIFDPNPCIFEGGPHHFQKSHALRYRHRKFGDDRMYIRGEWALRRWHWIKFQRYRLGC